MPDALLLVNHKVDGVYWNICQSLFIGGFYNSHRHTLVILHLNWLLKNNLPQQLISLSKQKHEKKITKKTYFVDVA